MHTIKNIHLQTKIHNSISTLPHDSNIFNITYNDSDVFVKQMELQEKQKFYHRKDLFEQLLEESSNNQPLNSNFFQNQEISQDRGQRCKCSKIGCLKLYCQCFNKGVICGRYCSCLGCQNHMGNQNQILLAKKMANLRHPNYFKGVDTYIPVKKCTCKKSHCIKKYCECFNAGIKCSQHCECTQCHNHDYNVNKYDKYSNMMQVQVRG